MRYIIIFIITFVLVLSTIFIIRRKSISIDSKVCNFLPRLYTNWCMKSYNKTYYEYMNGGIGNRIKGIVELLSLSLSNNYYPQSINNYKFTISIKMERI